MSWTSWIPRIAGIGLSLIPGGGLVAAGLKAAAPVVGEAVSEGLTSHDAVNKASDQMQAGTVAAQQQQQRANQAAGDVYTQQRADAQNLFGQPYQTLGSLLGMNIAPIGAPMGQVSTSGNPSGLPLGLHPMQPGETLQVHPGMAPVGGLQPATPATLAQLAKLAATNAKATSASGYATRRA